jgi:hypothetical protein
MKEFEVNFVLSSNFYIDANSEEEAQQIVNDMINSRIQEIEMLLYGAGIKDDDYVTDILEM